MNFHFGYSSTLRGRSENVHVCVRVCPCTVWWHNIINWNGIMSVKDRRNRNLFDYPDSHNLWNTQILTRIWPLLTRLGDKKLLLLQSLIESTFFISRISYLPVRLLFVFPMVSFRVWAFLYSAKLMWLQFLHLLKKKYENQFCINHLYTRKLDGFFSFLSRWFFDIFEFNPDQIRRAAPEQVRCSIVARNTSLVNQRDIHRHTVKHCLSFSRLGCPRKINFLAILFAQKRLPYSL